mmetsp:Transcript_11284/g.35813  ORF Transcript_11284/g.35813 Transcript_11284/m.35813 type:complete len:330 (-) Transcript_11284:1220-2209(-)
MKQASKQALHLVVVRSAHKVHVVRRVVEFQVANPFNAVRRRETFERLNNGQRVVVVDHFGSRSMYRASVLATLLHVLLFGQRVRVSRYLGGQHILVVVVLASEHVQPEAMLQYAAHLVVILCVGGCRRGQAWRLCVAKFVEDLVDQAEDSVRVCGRGPVDGLRPRFLRVRQVNGKVFRNDKELKAHLVHGVRVHALIKAVVGKPLIPLGHLPQRHDKVRLKEEAKVNAVRLDGGGPPVVVDQAVVRPVRRVSGLASLPLGQRLQDVCLRRRTVVKAVSLHKDWDNVGGRSIRVVARSKDLVVVVHNPPVQSFGRNKVTVHHVHKVGVCR